MNWSSWSEFFAMGGYGLYVWGSFGLTALVVVGEIVTLRSARRSLRQMSIAETDGTAPDPVAPVNLHEVGA